MKRFAALVCAFTVACTPAGFRVLVRNSDHKPVYLASVLLYDGLTSDLCEDDPIGGLATNWGGSAYVRARWCGDARLVVIASGYRPTTVPLDTCSDLSAGVSIELKGRPPEPTDADEMVRTAHLFVSAMAGKASFPPALLLADSEDALVYQRGIDTGRHRCDLHFVRSLGGADPGVEFALECAYGCRTVWRVHMVQQAGTWKVRGLTPAPSSPISSLNASTKALRL